MFGRSNLVVVNGPARTEYVAREVHEHRAPTDESVKLLREMEAKARDAVIQAVHVGDATFECVVHMRKNHIEASTTLLAIFSVNGKKLTADFTENDWRGDVGRLVEGLRSAMADKLSREILAPALRNFKLK